MDILASLSGFMHGLAIAALARGARVLARADLAAAAEAAAKFIGRELWDGEMLFRSFRGRRGSVRAFPAERFRDSVSDAPPVGEAKNQGIFVLEKLRHELSSITHGLCKPA